MAGTPRGWRRTWAEKSGIWKKAFVLPGDRGKCWITVGPAGLGCRVCCKHMDAMQSQGQSLTENAFATCSVTDVKASKFRKHHRSSLHSGAVAWFLAEAGMSNPAAAIAPSQRESPAMSARKLSTRVFERGPQLWPGVPSAHATSR